MEVLYYLLPALILYLVISLVYANYRKRVEHPVISRSTITWINLMILITAVAFGAGMDPKDALGLLAFAGIVTGLYFFFIRSRLQGKDS